MHGWEMAYRISECPNGWGSTLDQTEGLYLEVTDDGLGINQQIRERDNRLRRGRFVDPETASVAEATPGGPLTFAPRTDDILGPLMAHFQCVRFEETGTPAAGIGTGTFTFIAITDPPDWSGTTFGTHTDDITATSADTYCLRVDKIFGQNLETGQYTNNGIALYNALVTRMELSQRLGEDLSCMMQVEAKSKDESFSYGAGHFPPGTAGSYSSENYLLDWKGTVAFNKAGVATTLDLQEINYIFDNGQTDRRRLGTKNRVKFPYSGRPMHEGNLQWEFDRSDILDDLVAGGSFSIQSLWYDDALHWMKIDQPHVRLRDDTPKPAGGDSEVMYTLPFRAYGSAGTPASIVKVCTTFATKVWSFSTGEGTHK